MYDGEHSIRFFDSEYAAGSWTFDDPKIPAEHPHTWKTWHLIPTGKPVVKPPENDMNMLKIPGRHGLINPNKYTFGRPVFGNRTGSIEFILDPDYIWNWPVIYSEILTYFHGQERLMVLRDDRFYYYKGWFTVSDLEPGEFFDTVTLDYSLEPFKYERFTSGDPPQLWDDFNFLTGVLRDYRSVKVSGVAGTETSPPLEIVDRNGLFGTDDVPEITGLNTAGVLSAAIAEGGPLHGLEAALEAVPIAVGAWVEYTPLPGEEVIDVSSRSEMTDEDKLYRLNGIVYKYSADYTTAHLIIADGQKDRDVLISQAFADVIKNLTEAAAGHPLNVELGMEMNALTDILTELKDTASAQDTSEEPPTWETSDEDLAMLLGNVLPGAYFQTQWIRTVAQRGIVQARVGAGDWINVFDANAESYIDLAVGGDLGRRFLYLRTTIDTTGLYLNDEKIDPLVTVSVRGNTL